MNKTTELPASWDKASEYAAEHLPLGWIISINVECGSASVELVDMTNHNVDRHPIYFDGSIAEHIFYAVVLAQDKTDLPV